MENHQITRVRHDTVRRQLRVVSREQMTPRMVRLVFHCDELAGFDSPSPDDHIKLFFPAAAGQEPPKRDFTPRAWDLAAGTLTIDFALHPHGAATEWARDARPGDALAMGGPRGSTLVPDDFDWYLLVGDATALPSFSRRLEAMRAGVQAHVVLLLAGPEEQPVFQSAATLHLQRLSPGPSAADDVAQVLSLLAALPLPVGDGYIWIAAEESIARAAYRLLVETRQHPADWIKASAYWTESDGTGSPS